MASILQIISDAISKVDPLKINAPIQEPQFEGYSYLTYNYSGGRIPQMNIFGLPNSEPVPNLPTSIPQSTDVGMVDYSRGSLEMSAIGLPLNDVNLSIPINVPGQDNSAPPEQDLQGILPSCSLCNMVTNALLGGTVTAAPVNTLSAAATITTNTTAPPA